jgi:opacity protein-like surface antigen
MIKKTSFVLISWAALNLSAYAQHHGHVGEFNLRTDVGAAWVEDFKVGDTSLSFDTGVRVDVIPTYQWNEYLSLDFNTGFIWNNTDKVSGPGGTFSVDGDQWQFPFLVDVNFRFPTKFGLIPFIGGGGGGVYAIANVDKVNGDTVNDSDDDIFGAVQGVAGIEYKIDEKFSVGIVYKYLYMFTEETVVFPGGSVSSDNTRTHSVSLSLRLSY